LVLSLIMLVGSFAIGLLPALIKASNRLMNLISIVGAGLLVGVALVVIIPEGMITLNEALLSKPVAVDDELIKVLLRDTNLTLEQATQMHIPTEHTGVNETMYLGCSLVFGFLVMLLIDQLFAIIKERFYSQPEHGIDVNNEELISRTDCRQVQNSVQSTNKHECMKIARCESVKNKDIHKLSNDYTDNRLFGKYPVFNFVL
jgi:hypothetical protein